MQIVEPIRVGKSGFYAFAIARVRAAIRCTTQSGQFGKLGTSGVGLGIGTLGASSRHLTASPPFCLKILPPRCETASGAWPGARTFVEGTNGMVA
jgi:hypothetical protein